MADELDAQAFTILVVCSGNICRSPIGQQLLRARFAELGAPYRVLSGGTIASRGHAMPDEAQLVSRRYGGHPDGHLSTPLDEALVARSQLVLTASREHRAAVVSLLPRANRYSFTLKQFARLAQSLEPDELNDTDAPLDRVAAIAAQRGFAAPEQPEDDDIIDPYLEPLEVYEQVGAEIDAATRTIAEVLTQFRGSAEQAS